MSESIKTDVSKAKVEEMYKSIKAVEHELLNATIRDPRRNPFNVINLLRMSDGYIPQSTDRIKVDRNGNPSLKTLSNGDLLHTKSTWQTMNVSKGRLPSLYYSDGTEIPMTMNGIPIDLTNDETARKLNQIRNFPASLVNEGLEVISKTINKHFIVKIERKKDTCLYGAIETFQEAKITLQNLLFAGKAKMISTIKDLTTNIVLTHKDALEMKESLTLNIAMLEQAEAKVNGSRNDEIVVAIVDNFWDYFRNNSNTSPDAVSLIALLHELRDDRSKGVGTELFTMLDRIVAVFKPTEESGETLHAALLVNHEIDRPDHQEHAGGLSRAKGKRGWAEKRKTEPRPSSPQDQGTSETLKRLIDTVYNLKADIGNIKCMLQRMEAQAGKPSYSGKPKKWGKDTAQEKFANMAVQEKSSEPQPLTKRVVSIAESDDDSEQTAQFAGEETQEYSRVLTAESNETVLDRMCTQSHRMSLRQVSVGDKFEQFNTYSKRTDDQLQPMKLRRVQDPMDLRFYKGPFYGTFVSQLDGGKKEMVVMQDDAEEIQGILDATPDWMINRAVMYIPVPYATNGKDTKMNYKTTSKLEATPKVVEDEFMPDPNTPSKLEAKAQECILPPSAPQVEKYVLETSSSPIKSAKIARTEKPRTRSNTRAERFTIPASIDISEDEQDSIYTVVPKPYGLSTSFYEQKIPENYSGEDEYVFNKVLRESQNHSRIFPSHLRSKGRKEFTTLMHHITKAAMEDMESPGEPPLHHTVNPSLDNMSDGDHDDLPELITEEDSGGM